MKMIKTEEAVGHVLCHDMTRIIEGEGASVPFRKGHIVKESDIPILLSMGKVNLYVWEKEAGMLHENEAAERLYKLCENDYIEGSPVKEGKIELIATRDGLLKIDIERLHAINRIGEIIIATRHTNFPVKKGDKLAGTRVIPLVIDENKIIEAERIGAGKPLFEIKPFRSKKVAIVTTGNEVFTGRIQDAFGPVLREKCLEYDLDVIGQEICDDQMEGIVGSIQRFVDNGADIVLCTGGMSVDPDDTTPSAIKEVANEVVTYGAPILPGAMFMLAYTESGNPIMGLPGCVMVRKRTAFDLVFPRILAGEKLTREDIAMYGHGGLCLNCDSCTFPNCGFGK